MCSIHNNIGVKVEFSYKEEEEEEEEEEEYEEKKKNEIKIKISGLHFNFLQQPAQGSISVIEFVNQLSLYVCALS